MSHLTQGRMEAPSTGHGWHLSLGHGDSCPLSVHLLHPCLHVQTVPAPARGTGGLVPTLVSPLGSLFGTALRLSASPADPMLEIPRLWPFSACPHTVTCHLGDCRHWLCPNTAPGGQRAEHRSCRITHHVHAAHPPTPPPPRTQAHILSLTLYGFVYAYRKGTPGPLMHVTFPGPLPS